MGRSRQAHLKEADERNEVVDTGLLFGLMNGTRGVE